MSEVLEIVKPLPEVIRLREAVARACNRMGYSLAVGIKMSGLSIEHYFKAIGMELEEELF